MSATRNNLAQAWETEEITIDLQPLARRLGTTDGLSSLGELAAELHQQHLRGRDSFGQFLQAYKQQVLIPFEWTQIRLAWHFTRRNQLRELMALDREISRHTRFEPFAIASRRIGHFQLKRLRPLRDQRMVQRYLRAVEEERSTGWHTLVYGMILSVFSLPLRQGLLTYARQTLSGFVRAASGQLALTEMQCENLLDEITHSLPSDLDQEMKREQRREIRVL